MSAESTAQETAREALAEIQRYLADQVAPLMALDAAHVLLRLPPKYGAAAIRGWLEAQLNSPTTAGATISGYLYHAVKKIHDFSEFKLIDDKAMGRYLAELSRIVIQLCPGAEQTDLRLRLARMGETETTLSAPVRYLNRELGSEAEEQAIQRELQDQEEKKKEGKDAAPAAAPATSPRFTAMMGRLQELKGAGAAKPDNQETQELVERVVTKAAMESKTAEQFEASLEELRSIGIEPALDEVFRRLSKRLPGWEIEGGGEALPGSLLQAMERIVALADSNEDGVERFSNMVYAAVEQLNESHLAQAVSMLDVAERLVEEKKVDESMAGVVRTRAEKSVAVGPLRRFASVSTKHRLLRRVLDFFPSFGVDSLLARLDGEPKRDARKLMLSLLEVHGAAARPKLLERLAAYANESVSDPDGFFSRNVIFLLRRIPRVPDDDHEWELQLLSEQSAPDRPFMVVKEAVGAIANLGLAEAELVLTERLADFESAALSGTAPYDNGELMEILDRNCAALARLGTPGAVRALVEHGSRKEAKLGDSLKRLEYLAGCNLARHPAQLRAIVELIGKKLPVKLLGMTVGRRGQEVGYLVRAMSGSQGDLVQNVMQEIVQRFPGQEFADQAAEVLTKFKSKSPSEQAAAEDLTGDLELFGLPTLLQSLSDNSLTGRLTISESNGHDRATLCFAKGKIAFCDMGRLRGLDAVCQLFEQPEPGAFRFEKGAMAPPEEPAHEPLDVMSTVLEAVRRHDEFQEDRALVPDGTSLMHTGQTGRPPEDETDKEFLRAVWREAGRGTAPETCEGTVRSDSYRVRRLYAHWLEQGALKRRPAQPD